ncbi:hypothetical protein AB0I77_14610 [Streptomyces sp. NPDC050619]|uniref:hypothetical protein n=1 Tax=Streptomyces sp. NPDC050619 TaxID=3157214 RepID=UPI0034379C84
MKGGLPLALCPVEAVALLAVEGPGREPLHAAVVGADLYGDTGILERREEEAGLRRKIVSIADAHRDAINGWLGQGAGAWRKALAPLTAAQRRVVW